jgi:glutathione synthase
MDLAFIVDPLDELKAYKDSTVAMMREAQSRGHAVWAILQPDLVWRERRVWARAWPLEVFGGNEEWYEAGSPAIRALADFGAVVMRKDPPFDMEYVYSTYLLELAVAEGARVFNDPRAIRDHNEKLSIAMHAQWIAPSMVTRDGALLRAFVAEEGDVILKPLDAMGGASIFRVRRDDPNLSVIIETLTGNGTRSAMAQRFIPEIAQGDKRILVIAGEPVPHVLARIPQPGETRGNLAAGGMGVAQPLSARDREIAQSVGAQLWARGLFLVGLDVIGDYLTEINVTSPTCFVEIAQQSGFDVARMFVDALEQACYERGA